MSENAQSHTIPASNSGFVINILAAVSKTEFEQAYQQTPSIIAMHTWGLNQGY